MSNFADRLIEAITAKGTSCIVGLDPRLDQMPRFAWDGLMQLACEEAVHGAIRRFHEVVIETIAPMVPAVKLQLAFYEQYGLAGMLAFRDTIEIAKRNGLLVIADAKRNDISSTAQAYANAFLGVTPSPVGPIRAFNADCITVSPFLGRDSLLPFVQTCQEHGNGLFVLVKTSNPGSVDLQDQLILKTQEPVYVSLAILVDELGSLALGKYGYSSIGAVVGATFPEEADALRKLMPRSFFLVPGYGAQGGTAANAARCFNPDGLGALISASRSATYAFAAPDISRRDFSALVQDKTRAMIDDVAKATREHFKS